MTPVVHIRCLSITADAQLKRRSVEGIRDVEVAQLTVEAIPHRQTDAGDGACRRIEVRPLNNRRFAGRDDIGELPRARDLRFLTVEHDVSAESKGRPAADVPNTETQPSTLERGEGKDQYGAPVSPGLASGRTCQATRRPSQPRGEGREDERADRRNALRISPWRREQARWACSLAASL